MDVRDYPVDIRADYPQSSSRLWAILTIIWIKWLALLPHFVILIFLTVAQFVVALIAQFTVAFTGEYPAGMHDFITGVLRWQTRVNAFFLSLNDRYPPFSLQPVAGYPVDVAAERPAQPSRTYAIFTVIVEVAAIAGGIWLAAWLFGHTETFSPTSGSRSNYWVNFPSFGGVGLVLRQLAAIPHYIVLIFLGIAAFVIWFVVQWVILFVARFPYGMWEIVAGYVRWITRVNAYALGLVDRYPPFSMQASIAGSQGIPTPPPPPPVTTSWPQTPSNQPTAPAAPQASSPDVPAAPDTATQPEPPQPPPPPGAGA
jgi:hypothetical protein